MATIVVVMHAREGGIQIAIGILVSTEGEKIVNEKNKNNF